LILSFSKLWWLCFIWN